MDKKIKKPGALVNAIPSHQWKERGDYKKENRSWLKKSVDIALRVMDFLEERSMSQNDLAIKLNVTRQQVSKILKGQENLTLETISKLEDVLRISLVEVLSKESAGVGPAVRRRPKPKRRGLMA